MSEQSTLEKLEGLEDAWRGYHLGDIAGAAIERIAELEAQIEAVKKVRDTLMEYSLPEDDPEDPDLELAENVVKDLNQALKDSGGG